MTDEYVWGKFDNQTGYIKQSAISESTCGACYSDGTVATWKTKSPDYDIWAEVKPRIEEAFGKLIDKAIFTGEGKPTSWRAGIKPQKRV